MQVKLSAIATITEDAGINAKDGLFTPDANMTQSTCTNMTEECSDRFTLAALGTMSLSFGSVTEAHGLYVYANGDFNLVIDGGDPLLFRKSASTGSTISGITEPVFCLMPIFGFTSVQLISPTGSTATLVGRYCIWGVKGIT